MRAVKDEVRILGVDDAAFTFDDETTELIGTVFRGGDSLEAVLKDEVTVDGMDVTGTVLAMVNESRHRDQVQVVMLDGITFAGFNVIDLDRVADEGEVAVIAVSRKEPDRERMWNGLDNVDRADERKALVEKAGTVHRHRFPEGTVYFQFRGLEEKQAHEVLDTSRVRGLIPEPVRVAHLIAAALKSGESKGRA